MLTLVPPIIFAISRSTTGWQRAFKPAGLIVAVAAVMIGLLLLMFLGYSMDGSNTDTYDGRIIWLSTNPFQIVLFIALITAVSVLGRRDYRTLSLSMLTVGAGYFALWFGIGILRADGSRLWLIPFTDAGRHPCRMPRYFH